MGKQILERTRQILSILMVVFFIGSVTAITVNAYPNDRLEGASRPGSFINGEDYSFSNFRGADFHGSTL